MKSTRLVMGSALLVLTLGLIRLAGAQSSALFDGLLQTINNSGVTTFNVDGDGDLGVVAIGAAGSVPADMDLEVRDPNPTFPTQFGAVFDVNASIGTVTIGSGTVSFPGQTGEIRLQDGLGDTLLQLEGGTGNIEQEVDNTAIANGNGAVKAWAKINADGSVFQCWKCNLDAGETQRLGEGFYEVDFDLGNTQARPRLAVIDSHTTVASTTFVVAVFGSSDTSTVGVRTRAVVSGDLSDAAFTVFIF